MQHEIDNGRWPDITITRESADKFVIAQEDGDLIIFTREGAEEALVALDLMLSEDAEDATMPQQAISRGFFEAVFSVDDGEATARLVTVSVEKHCNFVIDGGGRTGVSFDALEAIKLRDALIRAYPLEVE